jgi:hypothetical protein
VSHRADWLAFCARRELAVPVDGDGRPFWRPGARAAGWRVCAGTGTVYSTTVVRRRDAPPRSLVLVDLDEGVRLMSRVVGTPPEDVRIGDRVRVAWDGDVPVFEVAGR